LATRLSVSRKSGANGPICVSVVNRLIRAVVDPLAQVFARLEVRHVFSRQRHRFTGFRVAPLARRAKVQREAAETADLDALAARERIAHDLQNLLESELDILGGQMLLLRR